MVEATRARNIYMPQGEGERKGYIYPSVAHQGQKDAWIEGMNHADI